MTRIGALAIVATTWLVSPPARAQDEPQEAASPEEEPPPDPRALFAEGALAYAAGRYVDAIGHFEAAFELRADPALLFDLGLAHERLGQDAQAIAMYERYLEAAPEADNRAHVRRRIRAARSRIEAADADPYAGPIALAVIAGVSFAAAGVFWLVGDAQYAELEDTCAARGCTVKEIDDSSVQTWDLSTNLALGIGGLATLASVVMLITRVTADDGDGGEEEDDHDSPRASADHPGGVRAEGTGGPRITREDVEPSASLHLGPTGIELRGAF